MFYIHYWQFSLPSMQRMPFLASFETAIYLKIAASAAKRH